MATFGDAQAVNLANAAQLTANGYTGYSLVTNDAWAILFPTPANCASISEIVYRNAVSSGSVTSVCCVWHSNGDLVSNGVSNQVVVTGTTPTYRSYAFATPPTLSPSTNYFFGIITDANTLSTYGKTNEGTATLRKDYLNDYTSPQALTNNEEVANRTQVWYATYTPTGATLTQEGYRWRLDDGDQANATWAAAQDTGITASANTTRRLRMLIDSSGDAPSANYQLEYKEANDANWTTIT